MPPPMNPREGQGLMMTKNYAIFNIHSLKILIIEAGGLFVIGRVVHFNEHKNSL